MESNLVLLVGEEKAKRSAKVGEWTTLEAWQSH